MNRTPASLGYRMPAEWERHDSTWLSWPHNKTTWPGRLLAGVEGIYLDMISALCAGERVNLLVPTAAAARRVRTLADRRGVPASRLVLHPVRTVDTWIRDYGPIFVLDKKRRRKAFTKWIFNAWGGKYADLARDTTVVDRVKALEAHERFDIRRVLEGGSIDVNGEGTLLTTEQCLMNRRRNPSLTRSGIEKMLREGLGARHVVWLKEGIEGDDTDGHVDDVTRFVAPRVIVTAVEDDPSDKNHGYLAENLAILKSSRDALGRPFKIVELPMPGRVGTGRHDSDHKRLPASYANFYIGNTAVLVPIYSHVNDKKALKILKTFFPGRRIVGIECTSLVYGLGSIHCVTQQEPSCP